MRRIAPLARLTLAVAVLVVAATVSGPASAPGYAAPAAPATQTVAPPRAWLVACVPAPDPAGRAATFTASMPAIAGTALMAVRFDLLERRAGDRSFARIAFPAWAAWQQSAPERTAFTSTRRVTRLRAGAAYRARVRFRWYGPEGKLLRRAVRVTRACRQPG